MIAALEIALIATLLTSFVIPGILRPHLGIRVIGWQGLAVGVMPLLIAAEHEAWFRAGILALASVGLKAVLFPWLLSRALRNIPLRVENPVVGPSLALLIGVLLLAFAFWLGQKLRPPIALPSTLVLPTALYAMLSGLFVLCSRDLAINQVLGYLMLENGIYLFGLAIARELPLLIEMGALLDVLFAVLVMGIAVFHISRTFDRIDAGDAVEPVTE